MLLFFRWLWMLDIPLPPLHPIIKNKKNDPFCVPIINKRIKMTPSGCNVQRSLENWGLLGEWLWLQLLKQFVRTSSSIPKAKISLILQHFLFDPSSTFTPPAHTPFNKVCYGLIGNYPRFKMIPNTTYIVLILKKYNRLKSSFFTFCAGYRFILTDNRL